MVNPEIVENFLAGKGLFDSQTYKDQDDSTISKELALIYPRLPIFSKLKHHQKVGFLLNVDREYFLDLFEMGLGKSITALATIQYLKACNKINKALILVPNTSLLYSWKDQIEEHARELTYVLLDGSWEFRNNNILNNNSNITIATYAAWMFSCCRLTEVTKVTLEGKKKKANKLIVDNKLAKAYESQYQAVVFDEITAAKSHVSNTFKLCSRFRNTAKYRYGLAGRAYSVDQHDLWSIFNVIDGGETLGNSLGVFRSAFFTEKPGYWGGTEYKFIEKKAPILNKFLRNRSIIYKTDECLDLPDQVFNLRKVVHSDEMMKNYNRIVESVIGVEEVGQLDGAFNSMRQICSGWVRAKDHNGEPHDIIFDENPKLDAVMEFLESLPETEKVVIFHHYQTSGHIISDALTKAKIKHEWLYGGNKNPKSVEIFTNNPKCRVFLGSSAAAMGLNLQVSRYCVFFEEPCSPLIYDQMKKRQHRIGQCHTVFYYTFLVHKSVEEGIHYSLMKGEDLYSKITKSKEIFVKLEA